MKKLRITAFALLALAAVSCSDDDDNTARLTSEEQAELVASSMGDSGFSGSAEQSAEYANTSGGSSGRIAACGFTSNGTFDLGATIGQITFDVFYTYTLALTCNANDEPQTFTSTFTYTGEFDGPRIYTNHAGNGSLVITSITTGSDFELNGSYDREGTFESKVGDRVSGSSNIDIEANVVKIDKSTHTITGGSAAIQANGTIQGRGDYSFSSVVSFNGDGTANIEVSGDTYRMNLQNSTIVKID